MTYSRKSQRDHLAKLIKNVSDQHGGDDKGFLEAYIQDVIKKYSTELYVAIECFESLISFGGQQHDQG